MTASSGSSRRTRLATVGVFVVVTVLAAALVSQVPASAAPPAQGAYGTIKGRLVWGGADAPKPKVLYEKGDTKAKDPEVCATEPIVARDLIVDAKSKGVESGIVYLVRPNGANAELQKNLLSNKPEVVIDQKRCQFIPFSTAMHKDQKLVFRSSDPVNHNVHYAGFTNAAYNRILPPNGKDEVKLVAERRPLSLSCDIHPWMKGYIMVFDHPFFAVTKPDGSFEIEGVPAGTQNLVVWHGTTGYVTPGLARGMPVTVKPGETTDVGEIKLEPSKVKLTALP